MMNLYETQAAAMKTLSKLSLLHLCTFNFISVGSDDGHRKPETKELFQVKHGTESGVAGVFIPNNPDWELWGDWPVCSGLNWASIVDALTCVHDFDVDINYLSSSFLPHYSPGSQWKLDIFCLLNFTIFKMYDHKVLTLPSNP